ncbi:MAG: SDR family oxidoreductase [Xanthomonadales bacterium]|jgi:nucleoside-diphosphate-sugar epimerase|nr:SDR family oxidoreductase [Xanthomonadales bacterium]MDH3922989.1 SDR family oxidoreductase [Xanthomonadales bacterium]MDH3940791.1 SDR family oxidoreductase [Xanthomonadales bacterium]MDH3999649.1 SDR family oxidoreductase [Xanthomonadales bacterium]
MSLTAFLSGATGFVGSNLARELLRQGWHTHVLVRDDSLLGEIKGLPVSIHQGDLTDRQSVMEAIPQQVDAVFHVGASTNFWSRNNELQDRVNIDGTQNMLDAAANAQAKRFIHTSSFTTWGFRHCELDERSERTGQTDWINYVRSKHLAEESVLQATREMEIDAVILNPAHILGPGDQNNWSRMIRMVNRGKLYAAPPGGGNFCDVREIAKAHVQAFHQGRSGEKYLLGGEYADFTGVVKIVGEVLDRRVPGIAAPAWVMSAWGYANAAAARFTGNPPDITPESAAMVSYRVNCDSSKAMQALNYRFTPIRTLIEITRDWMETRGLLS